MMNLNLADLSLENVGQLPKLFKGIAAGVLSIILIGLGYWLLIKPNIEEYDALKEQQLVLRSDFEVKQQQAANLGLYKQQLAEMNNSFGAMLKQLPPQNEMASLLEDISKTGTASGLTFELFQPEAEISHDFYVELPINIIVLGNYQQIAVFISRITQLSRIVTWHDFDLSVLSKEKVKTHPGDILEMKILAKIYRYKT